MRRLTARVDLVAAVAVKSFVVPGGGLARVRGGARATPGIRAMPSIESVAALPFVEALKNEFADVKNGPAHDAVSQAPIAPELRHLLRRRVRVVKGGDR